jgi:2,4-dienoyl-CoA reductase-like NADH-dependent reductase (Old Yellow Enzyme family)
MYSVFDKDGIPGDWHLTHLGALATGGAGLILTEATAVNAEGRITDHDTGLWNDAQQEEWERIVGFVHSQGAAIGIQLAHAGRKASTYPAWGTEKTGTVPVSDGGWDTVGPSPVAFGRYSPPQELDAAGIRTVIDDFVQAAVRSVAAGFDVLEIHAAHGYLLHQFLSPLSNIRTDEFGGDLANRARLLLEIVRQTRAAIGEEVPLLVRFSATDYADGGVTPEEIATVSGWVHAAGADLVDVSSGGNISGVTIPLSPGYQVEFAELVRRTADVPTSAVGLLTTAQQAEAVITSGAADAVMMGREFLRDPHFALRAAHVLGVDLPYWPGQYERARWQNAS